MVNHADAVRVGEHDWTFELTGLLQPGGTGHLTIAVQREPGAEYRLHQGVPSEGENGGDAGAHLAAIRQILHQRVVSNHHPRDVGDRVPRPRASVEGNAQIPGARRFAGE